MLRGLIVVRVRVVKEFEEEHFKQNKIHYEDLKKSSMMLYNDICRRIRSGAGSGSFVDVVVKASNVIEETTLMRDRIKGDEKTYMNRMMEYYNGDVEVKRPYAVSNVKTFQMRENMVKDMAIEIVTKMYRIWHEERLVRYEDVKPDWSVKEIDKAYDEKRISKDQWCKAIREVYRQA